MFRVVRERDGGSGCPRGVRGVPNIDGVRGVPEGFGVSPMCVPDVCPLGVRGVPDIDGVRGVPDRKKLKKKKIEKKTKHR